MSTLFFVKAIEQNYFNLFGELPSLYSLENPKIPEPSLIFTADSVPIGRYYRENRIPTAYQKIAPEVIKALIATEDVRFFKHTGIDGKALLGVLWYNLKGSRRGGSTISQQLAKNLFKTREKETLGKLNNLPVVSTLVIKIKEWITAVRLERTFTKHEILTMYLNTVDFGRNAFGIKAAAQSFFSVSPEHLTTEQAAVLIGLLKASSTYSPILNPDKSRARRNVVMAQMKKYGLLHSDTYDSLKQLPLTLKLYDYKPEDGVGSYYRQELNAFMQQWCQENGYDLHADGLRIYTTLDSRIQAHAEKAVQEKMAQLQKIFFAHWRGQNPWYNNKYQEIPNFLEDAIKETEYYAYLKQNYSPDSMRILLNKPKKMTVFSWNGDRDTVLSTMDSLRYYKHLLHAGMISIDPYTGHIKAWVGGADYRYFQYDHVKQARRQPGSTFKPFIYTAAIDSFDYSPCDRFRDGFTQIRYEEKGKNKIWTPRNADWIYLDRDITLRHAIGRSLNTVAAQLTEKVGWQSVADYAQRMGIKSPLAVVPSIGLGANDVNLHEMVGAYAVFMNQGVHTEPQLVSHIADKYGRVIAHIQPQRKRVIKPESAWLMLYMLRGGIEEPHGTSRGLYSYRIFGDNNQIAGKTGTSSRHADGWYFGLTNDLVTGVWVGARDRVVNFRSGKEGEGSKTAMPLFGRFLERLYQDEEITSIKKSPLPQPPVKILKPYICPTPYYEKPKNEKEEENTQEDDEAFKVVQ
ncbi:MAG: penicillin-binding protein [Bernardetiaceae bacterium]|nr:penicillin-binding protein [Bernardetiaceae bacterium]